MSFNNSYLFENFDWSEFVYPKNKKKLVQLVPGKRIDSSFGAINCDQILGHPEGVVVTTCKNHEVIAFRATLDSYTSLAKRKTAIIFPQVCAFIIAVADIRPGLNVLEAGVGSGALTIWLLNALAGFGTLYSFEERREFLALAKRNVSDFLGFKSRGNPLSKTSTQSDPTCDPTCNNIPDNWICVEGNLRENIFLNLESGSIDRVVLDMLKPWECVESVTVALRPGGIFVCYATGLIQVSRLVETLRNTGFYTEPIVYETLQRKWHIEGLSIRPNHSGMKPGGFLIMVRRLFKKNSLRIRQKPIHKHKFDKDDIPAWLPEQIG